MDFLKGLLYGLAFVDSIAKGAMIDMRCNPIMIWFEDGTHISFAINRGISHVYGNFTAMLTQKESCNLFDIVGNWLTQDQLLKIEELGFDFEDAEIRVGFQDLCLIINALGNIDYVRSQQEWLKIYLKKYHL